MGSHSMQPFRSLNAINILLSKKSETKVTIPILLDVYMILQWAFPVAQQVKNLPTIQEICRRHGFNPWVKKMPWRRKWQPTPIFLPIKSHGQRSRVGYSSKGSKESDMTEHAQKHKSLIIRESNSICLYLLYTGMHF